MSKLRKATIDDLRNKEIDIIELLEDGLARIRDVSELLEMLDNEVNDFQSEIEEWLGNKEVYLYDPNSEDLDDFYIRMVGNRRKEIVRNYKGLIDTLPEDRQIEIFKEYNKEEEQQIQGIVNLLSNYDINKVKKILESEGY